MLGSINKMSESTIVEKRTEFRGLDLSLPELTPLRRLGVCCAILSTVEGRYRMIRGNNGPLHTNFLYILEGELEVETSVGEWIVQPGTLIHHPSNISRRIELRHGPRYRGMYFKILHSTEFNTLRATETTIRPARFMDRLRFVLERCVAESRQQDSLSRQVLSSYAEVMSAYLQREVNAFAAKPHRDYKQELVELWGDVIEAPGEDWSLERMAARIPISPTHLYRLVRRHYDCSPKQYLTHLRMQQAKSLLLGNFTIAEVAQFVGYANEYSFSNAFHKETGQRPGTFRKQQQS